MVDFIKNYKHTKRQALSMFNLNCLVNQERNMALTVITTTDQAWKTQFINNFNVPDDEVPMGDEQQMRMQIIESFAEKPKATPAKIPPPNRKKPAPSNQLSCIPDPKPQPARRRTPGSGSVEMPPDMKKSEVRDAIPSVIAKGGLALFERIGWTPVGTTLLLIFPSGYYQTGHVEKDNTGEVYIVVDYVTPTDINCKFKSPQLWMHSAFEYRKRMNFVPNEDMLIEDQLCIQTQCYRYCQAMNVERNLYQLALAYSHFYEKNKGQCGASHTKNRKGHPDSSTSIRVSEAELIDWFSSVKKADHYDGREETMKMTSMQQEINKLKEENRRLRFAFAMTTIDKKKVFAEAYKRLVDDGELMMTSAEILNVAVKHIIKHEIQKNKR